MDNYNFDFLRLKFRRKEAAALVQECDKLLFFLSNSEYLKNNMFYHPLGFIYSKLHEFENKETIRIHIWNNEYHSQQAMFNIHNHYYIVNSLIYRGCLENKIFYFDEYGTTLNVYKGAYQNHDNRILKKTEETRNVSLKSQEIHCTNTLYSIPLDTLHTASPVDKDTLCTIVYTEKPRSPEPLVLGALDGRDQYFESKTVAFDIAQTLIKEIIQDSK
ncbi:hypothetical protein SAMN05660841_04075 [Sphingobacterium nematocida]|uniref:Cysteine dioxygenase type I n=1 Tax=Sphingobacterium nematocida TaxID=1513896 RepID=A0A1T5GHT4_9SPHI|nr:hypothetical protein [Sphingobacterium nematocida]SKC07951.1 hypothetical protein SAMN05660841_04075 [Sphingobacterium nematocida]